ncbi:hypothetical protein H6P81_012345 [Aristolochia fimbriata]|uniref:Uncharacterized protein n=1 Tax=Aristolochia fimbriata TaxID=158543 RepID=A0AAV7EF80_ARIFI|nr:hypothetical protein H6P81_012345 [Aristolochia fimbriata]
MKKRRRSERGAGAGGGEQPAKQRRYVEGKDQLLMAGDKDWEGAGHMRVEFREMPKKKSQRWGCFDLMVQSVQCSVPYEDALSHCLKRIHFHLEDYKRKIFTCSHLRIGGSRHAANGALLQPLSAHWYMICNNPPGDVQGSQKLGGWTLVSVWDSMRGNILVLYLPGMISLWNEKNNRDSLVGNSQELLRNKFC